MRILICGAHGFVGRQVALALERSGHTIVRGVSAARESRVPDEIPVDFANDTSPEVWMPRLESIDAVVNAVGVLRDTTARPIEAVHALTPIALFDACAEMKVRRVLHVSALGIDGSETAYATTKRRAETRLHELTTSGSLQSVILRPSIVFGQGGASASLFLNLSKLPVLWLPRPVLLAKVQPVLVTELAELMRRLIDVHPEVSGTIDGVGPRALTLTALMATLRAQAGKGRATVCALPGWVTQLSARLGDRVPASPWCSESLALLGKDNVADPQTFAQLLGRPATDPDLFLSRL